MNKFTNCYKREKDVKNKIRDGYEGKVNRKWLKKSNSGRGRYRGGVSSL